MARSLRRKTLVLRRKALNSLPTFLPFIIAFTHVLLSPHTKVEESFSLHAAHDVLAYGLSPSHFHLVPPF